MSRINVTVGTASVEIRTEDYEGQRGLYTTPYRSRDLIDATIKALRAVDTDDARQFVDDIERVLAP
jgi:hypothetical protein